MRWLQRWFEPYDRVIERQKALDLLCRRAGIALLEDRPEAALATVAEAWPLARKVAYIDPRWHPRLIDFETHALYRLERHDELERRLTVWMDEAATAQDPALLAKCQYRLALQRQATGQIDLAKQLARVALDGFRALQGDYRQDLALALGTLAELLNVEGYEQLPETQAARSMANEAIGAWQEMLETSDGFTVPPIFALPGLYVLAKRYEEGQEWLRSATGGQLSTLAPVLLAEGHLNLGLGRWRAAIGFYGQALDLLSQGQQTLRGVVLARIGHAHRSRSDYAAAEVAYRESAEMSLASPFPHHWNACASMSASLAVAMAGGRQDEARTIANRALALPAGDQWQAINLNNRGAVAAASGNHSAALTDFHASLNQLESMHGANDPRLHVPLVNLAASHSRLGQADQARTAVARALRLNLSGGHLLNVRLEAARLSLLGFEVVRDLWGSLPDEVTIAEDIEEHLRHYEEVGRVEESQELGRFAAAMRERLKAH